MDLIWRFPIQGAIEGNARTRDRTEGWSALRWIWRCEERVDYVSDLVVVGLNWRVLINQRVHCFVEWGNPVFKTSHSIMTVPEAERPCIVDKTSRSTLDKSVKMSYLLQIYFFRSPSQRKSSSMVNLYTSKAIATPRPTRMNCHPSLFLNPAEVPESVKREPWRPDKTYDSLWDQHNNWEITIW